MNLNEGLNRRSFLKGAALMGGAAAFAGHGWLRAPNVRFSGTELRERFGVGQRSGRCDRRRRRRWPGCGR